MDPTSFLAPASPLGAPAPYWLIAFFKVLGFTLHQGPMHLWFGGLILAMLLNTFGGQHHKKLSARLMQQMPIIISMGVNLGIVPLLFLQVSYYRVFYTTTILEAWAWFAIVALLCVAYYGVYVYAIWLKTGSKALKPLARWCGWIAALFFLVIGFVFSHTMSLLVNLPAWPEIWKSTSVDGAPLGIGNNFADPSLGPRYLMMFSLALLTVATYIALDIAYFARREDSAYHAWAGGFSWKLGAVGLIWFAACGSWYAFGTWEQPIREAMLGGSLLPLTALTAFGPAVTWLLLWLGRSGNAPRWAAAAGVMQFLVLALNATSRQIVQNRQLAPYLDFAAEQVNLQLSPLIVFLLLFVGGLALVFWMISKAVAVNAKPIASKK